MTVETLEKDLLDVFDVGRDAASAGLWHEITRVLALRVRTRHAWQALESEMRKASRCRTSTWHVQNRKCVCAE